MKILCSLIALCFLTGLFPSPSFASGGHGGSRHGSTHSTTRSTSRSSSRSASTRSHRVGSHIGGHRGTRTAALSHVPRSSYGRIRSNHSHYRTGSLYLAHSGFSSTGSIVHVNGYFKRDGTYVQSHYRTAPDFTKLNNWSTKGNVNPFTGEPGTKDP